MGQRLCAPTVTDVACQSAYVKKLYPSKATSNGHINHTAERPHSWLTGAAYKIRCGELPHAASSSSTLTHVNTEVQSAMLAGSMVRMAALLVVVAVAVRSKQRSLPERDRPLEEMLQLEKVKLQLLKALHLQGTPPLSIGSSSTLANVRRMVGIDRTASTTRPSGDDSYSGFLRDEDETGAETTVYLKGEIGSAVLIDYGPSILLTLKQQDRHLRVTNVRINVLVPTKNMPFAAANSSGAASGGREQPDIRVDVVHRIRDTVKIERVDVSSFQSGNNNWYRLEVQSASVRGVLTKSGTVELLVRCTNCLDWSAVADNVASDARHYESYVYMALVGKQKPRKSIREKSTCDGRCCLRELTVDFNKLGPKWHWILKPRQFRANYCSGSCLPSALLQEQKKNLTATTNLVSAMLQLLKQDDRSNSCCVPTSSVPVEIIYVDADGTVRFDRHALHTVTGCACN